MWGAGVAVLEEGCSGAPGRGADAAPSEACAAVVAPAPAVEVVEGGGVDAAVAPIECACGVAVEVAAVEAASAAAAVAVAPSAPAITAGVYAPPPLTEAPTPSTKALVVVVDAVEVAAHVEAPPLVACGGREEKVVAASTGV